MDLLLRTKKICKSHNIKPSRSKGQNFLVNNEIYDKIVEVADLNKDDVVLEAGPGFGFLTEKLAGKVKKVIAVELDDKLAEFLKETESLRFFLKKNRSDSVSCASVNIINNNILDINPIELGLEKGNYKIVANIPYNISSVFLRKFLSSENKPKLMVLMLQKEVAERIIATSGKMSLLAVSAQFYADAEIIDYVDKNNFWPKPEVDSAIIKLKLKSKETESLRFFSKKNRSDSVSIVQDFFRLVRFGFSSRRKMLKNNLAGGYRISQKEAAEKIKKAGFGEKIRAQELLVQDWVKLFGEFR